MKLTDVPTQCSGDDTCGVNTSMASSQSPVNITSSDNIDRTAILQVENIKTRIPDDLGYLTFQQPKNINNMLSQYSPIKIDEDTPYNKHVSKQEEEYSIPEEEVIKQTTSIFHNFVLEMESWDKSRKESSNTDKEQEISNKICPKRRNCEDHSGLHQEIARQMIIEGDRLNDLYKDDVDEMIFNLHFDLENRQEAYRIFENLSRKIFLGNEITWTSIITLMWFGYRISVRYSPGNRIYNSRVARLVSRFISVQRIATWISRHGGWIAALSANSIWPQHRIYLVLVITACVFIRSRF